LIFKTFIKTRS